MLLFLFWEAPGRSSALPLLVVALLLGMLLILGTAIVEIAVLKISTPGGGFARACRIADIVSLREAIFFLLSLLLAGRGAALLARTTLTFTHWPISSAFRGMRVKRASARMVPWRGMAGAIRIVPGGLL